MRKPFCFTGFSLGVCVKWKVIRDCFSLPLSLASAGLNGLNHPFIQNSCISVFSRITSNLYPDEEIILKPCKGIRGCMKWNVCAKATRLWRWRVCVDIDSGIFMQSCIWNNNRLYRFPFCLITILIWWISFHILFSVYYSGLIILYSLWVLGILRLRKHFCVGRFGEDERD